jgi:hypothetical protein
MDTNHTNRVGRNITLGDCGKQGTATSAGENPGRYVGVTRNDNLGILVGWPLWAQNPEHAYIRLQSELERLGVAEEEEYLFSLWLSPQLVETVEGIFATGPTDEITNIAFL